MLSRGTFVGVTIAVMFLSSTASVSAQFCGFSCNAPQTFAEQLGGANVILLAERISSSKQAKQTTFLIRHVGIGESEELRVGGLVTAPYFLKNKKPRLWLLFATQDDNGQLQWSAPLEASESLLKYVLEAPAPDIVASERLPYFLRFLESDEPLIADDAFLELNSAEWEDILACTSQLPRDKLREWLRNPQTKPTRIGLYAELLGVCGNKTDAEELLEHIRQPTNDFRFGMDGYNIAYLWRTGEKGLAVLDELKLRPNDSHFSERYAVMQAIRFMVAHGSERISRERACESMRLLLEAPEFADLAIADLGRWEDWSAQDCLMSLYGQGEYDNRPTKRAIVRYLLKAAKVQPPNADEQKQDDPTARNSQPEDLASTAQQAQASLEALRAKDPKTVQEAERFFLLLQ